MEKTRIRFGGKKKFPSDFKVKAKIHTAHLEKRGKKTKENCTVAIIFSCDLMHFLFQNNYNDYRCGKEGRNSKCRQKEHFNFQSDTNWEILLAALGNIVLH